MLQVALLVLGCVALVLGARALQASLAKRAVEQAAAQRLVGVAASVERLLARGLRAEAEEALRAFVQEPEHYDSGAVLDALLLWAAAMEARKEPLAALAVLVEAFMALPAGDPREAEIALRIGRQFATQWRFPALTGLTSQALQRWPEQAAQAEWVGLRADAALARGDLSGFVAAVDTGAAGPQREAIAPLVRALAEGHCVGGGLEHAYLTDLAGDGRPEVMTLQPGTPRTQVTLHRMDATLTPLGPGRSDLLIDHGWVHQLPLTRSPGGPAYVIGHDPGPGVTVLFELGAGEPRELLRWEDHAPQASAAADLDGDGLRELYVGTGTYTRKLHRLGPDANGVWSPGTTGTTGEDTAGAHSFAVDIWPIFEDRCSCHDDANGAGKLRLAMEDAYTNMVDKPSNQAPMMMLVKPGSAEESYLWHKLNDTQDDVGGKGKKMPPSGKLKAAELELIQLWIDEGAKP